MSVLKIFPTLYKRDSKAKVLQWDLRVIKNDSGIATIVTTHGQEGGKMQTTRDPITKGKNIGKANETTPEQQALAEAEAKWTKQQERKGYVADKKNLDTDTRPGFEPMLAHRYDKYPEKIVFPCIGQPKLDGHRCGATVENQTVVLTSRKREVIQGLPHIELALAGFAPVGDAVRFDGELYNHDYKDKFEELTGFIRSKTPKEGFEVVQYHIYDLANENIFYDRWMQLKALFEDTLESQVLIPVIGRIIEDEADALKYFKECVAAGYEGAMLRNFEGLYVGKRSYDLQKVKSFEDAEFKIVGVKEGRGKLAGHAIFSCETQAGAEFDVKLKGETERLAEIYQNPEPYLGQMLTVQFQGYTNGNVPRFPVGLRIRED